MTNKEKVLLRLKEEKAVIDKKNEEDAIRHSLRVKARYSLDHALNAQRIIHGRNIDLLTKKQIEELLDLIIDKKWMTVIMKFNQYFSTDNK
jgi:hypothetical protein